MQSISIPKVSVIIPTYNGQRYLADTIESVLAQSMPDLEVIIIDDGSTDNTPGLVQDFIKRNQRVRYFRQERKGVSAARNRGISESRAKFIAFIDHDDLWLPEKLEKQLALFDADPGIALVYARTMIINELGRPKGMVGGLVRPQRGNCFEKLLEGNFIPLSSAVVKKDALVALGVWFVQDLEMLEEIELFLRLAYSFRIDYCGQILAQWRMHSDNDSRLRRNLMIKEYGVILERLSLHIPDFEIKYRNQIRRIKRWMAFAGIEEAFAVGNRRLAADKSLIFFKTYGMTAKEMIKFLLLSFFGYRLLDRMKVEILNILNKIRKQRI